jgi:hypothetical protein
MAALADSSAQGALPAELAPAMVAGTPSAFSSIPGSAPAGRIPDVVAPAIKPDRENPSGLDENGFDPAVLAKDEAQRIQDLNAFNNATPENLAAQKTAPTWNDVFNAFNTTHKAQFGKEINRTWNGDQDAANAKLLIDNRYQEGLAAWNKANNGNVAVDKSVLGVDAQPNSYTPDKHNDNNFLKFLALAAGGYFLGPLALEALGIGGTTAVGLGEAALGAGALTPEAIAASELAAYPAASLSLEAGAGALPTFSSALPSVNEMIASGTFTPGAAGALNAGTLTAEQLAASQGLVTAGATPALVDAATIGAQNYIDSGGASLGGGGGGPNGTDIFKEISKNQAVASGMGPGSMGADLASKGLLTPAELAASYGVVTNGSLLANLPKLSNVFDLLGKTSGTSANTSNTYISGGTTGGSSSGPWNSYLTPQVSRIGAIQPTAMANPLAGLVSPIATNYTPSNSMLANLTRNNFAKGGEVVKADLSKFEPEFVDLIKKRSGGSPDHHHPNYNGNPLFRTGGAGRHVQGPGTGQSDDIPAMLADGEYVFDADTVSALGDGSNKAGASALDQMRKAIRKHKRGAPIDKIPPKAKNPLEYLRGK